MDIKTEVMKILSSLCCETVEENDLLKEDLGFSSLDMIEILMRLEETFNIEIDESDMNPYELKTSADVIKLAEKYAGKES